jgi:hypothetical protein
VSEVVTTGFVRKGRLEIRNRKRFTGELSRMRDGEVLVMITKKHATRSAQANRYYWGVVVELLAQHTGYTPEEIHEILKARFIPKKLSVANGNGEIKGEFVIGGTTTSMNKLEFGEYITSIRQWAAEELDVVIPDPDTGRLWPMPSEVAS